MTTDTRTYAALIRPGLPDMQVPDILDDSFYAADRAYLLNLQKKLNEVLKIHGMAKLLAGEDRFQLRETGLPDPQTLMLIDNVIKTAPNLDAKKIAEDASKARAEEMPVTSSESAYNVAQIVRQDTEKKITEITQQTQILTGVLEFHTDPDSDYIKNADINPVIGLKMGLQDSGFTADQKTGENTYLALGSKTNDWQFALAAKKFCRAMQGFLNDNNDLTGMPAFALSGEDSPEFRAAMDGVLQHPEAAPRLGRYIEENGLVTTPENLALLWENYKKLTPDQLRLMDTALDYETRRFINTYVRAQNAEIANTSVGKTTDQTGRLSASTVKAVDMTTENNPDKRQTQITQEQEQLGTIASIVDAYEPGNLRNLMNDAKPGWMDKLGRIVMLGYHPGLNDSEIDFAIGNRGHFIDVMQMRQAAMDYKPAEKPTTVEGQRLWDLQRYLVMNARGIYGPDTGLGRIEISGKPGDLVLSQNLTALTAAAREVVLHNLADPAFATHFFKQTNLTAADVEDMAPGECDEAARKLIGAVASYTGGLKGAPKDSALRPAWQRVDGLTGVQISEIRAAPVEAMKKETKDLCDALGLPFDGTSPEKTAESYTAAIAKYQELVRGKAETLSAYLGGNNADEAEAILKDFPGPHGHGAMLSGDERDPTASLAAQIAGINSMGFDRKDPVYTAARHIVGLNIAIGAMSPLQKQEIDNRAVKPAVSAMQTFLNQNLRTLNAALPERQKIKDPLPVNGDYHDPAFLRACAALQDVDHGMLLSGTLEQLEKLDRDLAPISSFLVPRVLGVRLTGRPAEFADDFAAVKAAPLLQAKMALKEAAASGAFPGTPDFDPGAGLLNPYEPGFTAARRSFVQNREAWLKEIPRDVWQAATLPADEIAAQINKTFQENPELKPDFDESSANLAKAIAQEQGIDETSPGFKKITFMAQIQTATQMGIFTQGQIARMGLGEAPPEIILADALQDSRFAAKIGSTPVKRQYLEDLHARAAVSAQVMAALDNMAPDTPQRHEPPAAPARAPVSSGGLHTQQANNGGDLTGHFTQHADFKPLSAHAGAKAEDMRRAHASLTGSDDYGNGTSGGPSPKTKVAAVTVPPKA